MRLPQQRINRDNGGIIDAGVIGWQALDTLHDFAFEIPDNETRGRDFIAHIVGCDVVQSVERIPEVTNELVYVLDTLGDRGAAGIRQLRKI